MSWDAAPTGRRGRQQTYGDAVIQTCLSIEGAIRHGAQARRRLWQVYFYGRRPRQRSDRADAIDQAIDRPGRPLLYFNNTSIALRQP
ncbi:hypothetical protein BV379_06210 [Rhodovulum sulfidophilum]|nr:hypothetical protein BV379_06210 [Rhodovulum sulfidophilum]